jgi:hypothetical protein
LSWTAKHDTALARCVGRKGMHVAPEQLPSKTESVACPKYGTELVVTRITPVLFVGEFEHLTLVYKTCGFAKHLKIKHS